MLEIDDFSRELCGGTHVSSTSQIGLFKITASQSVGANTRRIEAITSAAAIEHYRGLEHEWDGLAAELKVRPDRVGATVEKLAAQVHDLEKKLKAAESGERRDLAAELLAAAVDVGGVAIVAGSPEVETADELLTLVDEVRASAARLRRAPRVGRWTAAWPPWSRPATRPWAAASRPATSSRPCCRPSAARAAASPPWRAAAAPRSPASPAALEAGAAAVKDLLGG